MATRYQLLPLVAGPRVFPFVGGLTVLAFVYSAVEWRAGLVTGVESSRSPWVLPLISFVFFMGAGAGGILVAAIVHARESESATLVGRVAEVVALNSLGLAAVFLVLNLARSARVRDLGRFARLGWSLVWDVASVTSFMGLAASLAYLAARPHVLRRLAPPWRGLRLHAARDRDLLRELGAVSLSAAALLYSASAVVLGLLGIPPGGWSVLVAPLFAVPALASGLALVIVAAAAGRVFLGLEIDEGSIWRLGRVLFWSIPVLGYCVVVTALTVVRSTPSGFHILEEMLLGVDAGMFWLAFLGGLVAPFLLLAPSGTCTVKRTGFAALLVVMGMLTGRWTTIVPPLLGHAHPPYGAGGYVPAGLELAYTVGTYVVALVTFLAIFRCVRRRQ